MKFLKSFLMGSGGVLLAGLVLALIAPKAVHAVVATAVQVVNTSANPAITEDASLQASQIVTIQCNFPTTASPQCYQILPNARLGGTPGPHGGYLVPANQSFVLKSMDTVTISSTLPQMQINLFDEALSSAITAELVTPQPNGQISFSSGIVCGPGTEVIPFAGNAPIFATATFHGYLTSN